MSTYIIGDIQGCYLTFKNLLQKISFDPQKDKLWLAGDLVNRGPRSLEVLQWAKDHTACLVTVLGNHDLHLLAYAHGLRPKKPLDSLQKIIRSPQRDHLLTWLRKQPFIHIDSKNILVHAASHPQWSLKELKTLAHKAHRRLAGRSYENFLKQIYQTVPASWREAQQSKTKLAYAVQVLTRLRVINIKGQALFQFSGKLNECPPGYHPWFQINPKKDLKHRVFFGHWSDLGLYKGKKFVCLDSGCVWRGPLTAYQLENKKIYQVPYAD